MQANGANLMEILLAGEWRYVVPLLCMQQCSCGHSLGRSAAFMRYLDVEDLEAEAVLEAHWAQSEDEAE